MASETSAFDVPPHVLEYMREKKTLTLATASPAAVPRATTLVYVNDGVTLFVWTQPETTTARQIEQNPVVSFAIDEFAANWREIKGLQGIGECQVLLDSVEIERIVNLFETKYPSLAGALSTSLSFFRIAPTVLRFIDNTSEGAGEGETITFHQDLVYNLFRDLPEQQVETLEAQLRTIEVAAGDVIVRQGAPADKFFIVVSGAVEVFREDAEQSPLATLGRGQFFGEIAILRDMPRMATVRALEPTTLFAMEREVFRSLVAQSMGTTEDFDRVIKERIDQIRSGEKG